MVGFIDLSYANIAANHAGMSLTAFSRVELAADSRQFLQTRGALVRQLLVHLLLLE